MDARTRKLVRTRAGDRCEYCRLPQIAYDLTFHIDHVVASQHRIDETLENLALACDRCNLHKGPNLASIDPTTGERATLFNPRTQIWAEHFTMSGAKIEGSTPSGRATVRLLNMNAERRLLLRRRLLEEGLF